MRCWSRQSAEEMESASREEMGGGDEEERASLERWEEMVDMQRDNAAVERRAAKGCRAGGERRRGASAVIAGTDKNRLVSKGKTLVCRRVPGERGGGGRGADDRAGVGIVRGLALALIGVGAAVIVLAVHGGGARGRR